MLREVPEAEWYKNFITRNLITEESEESHRQFHHVLENRWPQGYLYYA